MGGVYCLGSRAGCAICTDSETVVDSSGKVFIVNNIGNLNDFWDTPEIASLGQGGFGTVSKATSKTTGSVRAIKAVTKDKVDMGKIRHEISILQRMDHPFIVKLYESFEDYRNLYLVMELCSGGDLYDRICDESLSFTEKQAAILMMQVLSAVNYMHNQRICHRDVKAENFMFQSKDAAIETNTVKLIDFGLSEEVPEGTLLTKDMGTLEYMAPEIFTGTGYGLAIDNWSCGVLTFEIMSGCTPFYAETDKDIMNNISKGRFFFDPADWRNISDDCKSLISGLLKRKTKDRMTAEQALNHTWIQDNAPRSTGKHFSENLIHNMRRFRSNNKLKKAALHVIAAQLDDDHLRALRDCFQHMDENKDGTLTLAEITSGLTAAGLPYIPEDLKDIMKDLDKDNSGLIDYTEFLAAALDSKVYLQEEVCWASFRVFDTNGDGHISKKELANIFRDTACSRRLQNTAIDLDSIMAEVDMNQDGKIDFDEFMVMMRDMAPTRRDSVSLPACPKGQRSSIHSMPSKHSEGTTNSGDSSTKEDLNAALTAFRGAPQRASVCSVVSSVNTNQSPIYQSEPLPPANEDLEKVLNAYAEKYHVDLEL